MNDIQLDSSQILLYAHYAYHDILSIFVALDLVLRGGGVRIPPEIT